MGFAVPSQLAARTLASLPVRIPTVESLLSAAFGFASRLRLAVCYGYHHRFRLAPFIQRDSAHAGHTGAGDRFLSPALDGPAGRPRKTMACPTSAAFQCTQLIHLFHDKHLEASNRHSIIHSLTCPYSWATIYLTHIAPECILGYGVTGWCFLWLC